MNPDNGRICGNCQHWEPWSDLHARRLGHPTPMPKDFGMCDAKVPHWVDLPGGYRYNANRNDREAECCEAWASKSSDIKGSGDER